MGRERSAGGGPPQGAAQQYGGVEQGPRVLHQDEPAEPLGEVHAEAAAAVIHRQAACVRLDGEHAPHQ
ncbi:hypothetical protein [Streptomyces sp. UG1]|uniref:hypothetical protein n=1 Tax=Streptomyces sp. UG1 TaxID=3417652 RepID=UPI003CF919F3